MESYNTVLLVFTHQRLAKEVINFVGNLNNMEKIKIGDKTYKLNIEKAKELGLIEEESTFKVCTDYETGAMVISE